MSLRGSLGGALLIVGIGCLTVGCAQKHMVLDLYGSIVYEMPQIVEVSHSVTDLRAEGGSALIEVTLQGDPGLSASFDIYPGIVERHPMTETADGSYVGELEFPPDNIGGTFTVTGRLRHPEAGEAVQRDTAPLIITRTELP